MTNHSFLAGALALATAVNGWAQPNMIVILADDFGVGSVNAYGAPPELVRTPHLDQLAQQGMRFTNASTPSSICSPTRYALLTGRYAWRGPPPFGVVNVYDPMVIETLEYEGIAQDTLILFAADNGGDIPANDPTRPEVQARAAGLLANGAQRGDKHTIYEGGLRVPLIVRWDDRVASGTVNDHMVNLVDICATLVEAATGEAPPVDDAPDSVSFLASLLGRPSAERGPMVVSNVAGVLAVRSGKWKWIEGRFPDGVPPGMRNNTSQEATPALYDLEADPAEAHNVIGEYPEVAQEMRATLGRIRTRNP